MTSAQPNGASELEDLITRSLGAAMNRTVAPPLRQLVRLAAAVFAALAGVVFLMVGAYLALATVLAPHWAAVIVGGAAVGLAAVLWVVGYLRRAMARAPRHTAAANGEGLSPVIDAVAREIKASPKEAAAIALALGAVTGCSPAFRQSIGRFFDQAG